MGSDKAAALVAHYVRAALAADERYELAHIGESLGSPDVSSAQQALKAARENVIRARSAYDGLDLDQAVELLNAALRDFERYAAYTTDMKEVADVLMLLGATHILRGEESKGRERLGQAVSIAPKIEPDPRIFNPSMRSVFQSTSDAIIRAPRGVLQVESTPSYAQVFVDGAFAGISPLAVEGLVAGRHYLRLAKDGYREHGGVIQMKGNAEHSERPALKPAKEFEDFDTVSSRAIKAMTDKALAADLEFLVARLFSMLSVDLLFLAEVKLDGEKVVVTATQFDLESDDRRKSAVHSFAYDSQTTTYEREVGVLMSQNFGKTAEVAATGGATGAWGEGGLVHAGSNVCPFGMRCDEFRSFAFWTLGGGGAALAGIGGLFYYLAYSSHQEFLDTGRGSDDSDKLRSSGKLKALLGDIFMFTGAAALVTGVTMYLYYAPSATPEQVVSESGPRWGLSFVPLVDGGAAFLTGQF